MSDRTSGVRARLGSLLAGVRMGQFLSAGVVGAVVDNTVLFVLVGFVGLGPVVGKIGSWEAAVIVIFLINEHWTFSGMGTAGTTALGKRFLTSNLIRVGGLAVTTAVLYALTTWFGVWYIAANVVGIGVGFVVNYVFENFYTWRVHIEHEY